MPAPNALADALAIVQALAEQDELPAVQRAALGTVLAPLPFRIEHGPGYMRIVARHPETGEEFEVSLVSKERGK